jgi:hypothetical protein
MVDPFAGLGLAPDASLDDVRAARRRLAKQLHPDHGGDADAMRNLNAIFDAAVKAVLGRGVRPASAVSDVVSDPTPPRWSRRRRVERDFPSFTISALPAEAFEAVLVVTSWFGDVLDDDSPYRLEARLDEPDACWVRLDLVPDAGSSTVSVTVVSDAANRVSADDVRDLYVRAINKLGDIPAPQ